MLGGFAIILLCQLVGELVVRLLGWPIPGSVIGMILFFGWLTARRTPDASPEARAGDLLVKYMPILFVPATVGWVAYGPQVLAQWFPALAGAFGSWVLTLLLAGWAATLLRPRRPRGAGRLGPPDGPARPAGEAA